MLTKRPSGERGGGDHGWLNTRHTFSFSEYHDPNHMGFRVLRVINEDRVQPGQGFGTHGHRDMEIVTYVLEGALAHEDSLGNGSILRPGEFQRMTAGTGIRHSEFNSSDTDEVHFYQIWLLPRRPGLEPSYEQRSFPTDERNGKLRLVASPDGREGSLTIQQDVGILLSSLAEHQAVTYQLKPARYAWLQVLRGSVDLNGESLSVGDGVAIADEPSLTIRGVKAAEIMLFDLP